MADTETGAGGGDTGERAGRRGGFDLHGVVVSYEGVADRCTVYPRGRHCIDRTTEWLSADVSAFVDLADAR
jgi:hypothetical protein